MTDLAVIILTLNEELHIARALASLRELAAEIVVVDSGSTDRTTEIAREQGAMVLHHPFINQAKQFQWALDHAPLTAGWVMRLDADEVIEPDLAEEIALKLPLLARDITGVNLKRKHFFMGRWIRHGGRYPVVLLRIWRRGKARIEDRWMDEHMLLTEGRAVTFTGGFADHNLNDLTFFTDKHNKYATREAVEIINQYRHLFPRDSHIIKNTTSSRTGFKRLLKEHVYNNIPFQVSAAAYFILRYVVFFGFLDGKEGLIYHFLQGFWYRFLVGAKTAEFEIQLRSLAREDALKRLEQLTGLQLQHRP